MKMDVEDAVVDFEIVVEDGQAYITGSGIPDDSEERWSAFKHGDADEYRGEFGVFTRVDEGG